MLAPIFSLELNRKLLPGKVTVGRYDGAHACITACTTTDKILIHSPHQRFGVTGGRLSAGTSESSGPGDIVTLNANAVVTALCAGRLIPSRHNDALVVGTGTHVLAYDVYNNADIFYNELADGANAIAIGRFGEFGSPLALVGGDCSVHGFDAAGADPYWTVSGDNVSAIALADYDADGVNELLVGSDDFEIRVFRGDALLAELTETDGVTALTAMHGTRFGYALANGTVGVYDRQQRWWRIKSKNKAISVLSYDLDGDGVEELITGWSSGKVDARNDRSGEVVFKDNFDCMVAGIVEGDYKMDGKNQLLCCSENGDVRGYQPSSSETRLSLLDVNFEQETVRDLSQRRHNLLLELKNYERNVRVSTVEVGPAEAPSQVGVIPANTQLQTGLAINMGSEEKNIPPHVEVALATTNDTLIRAVIIFAEGIFSGESHVLHPRESVMQSSVRVPIFPPKDVPVDLHVKAAVGYRGSLHFHVFELTRQLPRFSMYALCTGSGDLPEGVVKFKINERVARVLMWLNSHFLLLEEATAEEDGGVRAEFVSLRAGQTMSIQVTSQGHVTIHAHDMHLAADLIQAMADYLGIENLNVEANFPREFSGLTTTLQKVRESQAARQKLTADMAGDSGAIRAAIVRAEDARLIEDYQRMRGCYCELSSLNGALVAAYKIRVTNHEELLAALKKVNQTIQKAGRLRVGVGKTSVVGACRQAIKNDNLGALVSIMKTGSA